MAKKLACKELKKPSSKPQSQNKPSLKDCLLNAVKQSIDANKGLCVAYSGGLDSSVLLHLVALLKQEQPALKLCAFHVNHGISQYAKTWQLHCAKQAKHYSIAFHSTVLALSKQPQVSLEAMARDARYHELSEFAQTQYHVLLAQHQDDQAETFILQLKRGAGVKGLSGMPKSYTNEDGTVFIRPLLNFSRQQLAQFARDENLSWVEDESNLDERFERNFVRQSLMPILHKRWPQIAKTISRSAENCASTQSVVNEYMQSISKRILLSPTQLSIERMQAYASATQKEFLRFYLSNFNELAPSSAQLDAVMTMLHSNEQAKHIQLQTIILEKCKNVLMILDANIEQPSDIVFEWQEGKSCVLLPDLAIEALESPQKESFFLAFGECKLQFGSTNMKTKMQVNRPSKSLKKWYQEWSISALQRAAIPVLTQNEQVVALRLPIGLLENPQSKVAIDFAFESRLDNTHSNKANQSDRAQNQKLQKDKTRKGCWAIFVDPSNQH